MREVLIQKFFRKECTKEEAIQVAEYLKAHPEIVNKYLSEEEWRNIETTEMPEIFWEAMWQTIEKRKRAKTVILWLKRSAVAASMAGLVAITFFKFSASEKNEYVKLKSQPHRVEIVASTKHKTFLNTSAKTEKILLPDSSIVELSKGSVIKYDTAFKNNKREIELEGDAYFKVAKDKTKPFTVYAGGLATTALGTEFRVSTTNNSNNILVQLFRGKVVIRSLNNNIKGWNRDVYLDPGQQLQYNAIKTLVAVEKIGTPDEELLTKQGKSIRQNKGHSYTTKDLVFNSNSLPEVMEGLSKYFNAKIFYNREEIEARNFTGTFSQKDSLAIILKVIAQMNDLQVNSTDSGFMVEKINSAIKKDEQ
jgi:transmembrane sensor